MDVAPGVRTIRAPGHTPGHVGVEVRSEGETLLHLVDLALFPVHIEHPGWHAAFDLDPDALVASRERLFGRASETNALVMGYHFPTPGFGRIDATSGYESTPLSALSG
jgi:glyoxylase-like metal-dependent hydrolase (beta-lactamase superfamily II)